MHSDQCSILSGESGSVLQAQVSQNVIKSIFSPSDSYEVNVIFFLFRTISNLFKKLFHPILNKEDKNLLKKKKKTENNKMLDREDHIRLLIKIVSVLC